MSAYVATNQIRTLATISGKTGIVRERSWSPSLEDLGEQSFTMTLYWFTGEPSGDGNGCIEFRVPDIDESQEIGIWTELGELSDYDGTICELAPEMIKLLESVGIKVGEDYRPEPKPEVAS